MFDRRILTKDTNIVGVLLCSFYNESCIFPFFVRLAAICAIIIAIRSGRRTVMTERIIL